MKACPAKWPLVWMSVISALVGEPLCAFLYPQQGWCMEFKTSQVTTFLGQERDAEKLLDYFTLKVSL